MRWISLISSGHSIQTQKNTISSQMYRNILHDRPHLRSLIKFKKIEIISIIFSDYNAMRLDIKYKKKNSNKNIHMEIKQKLKKILETNDNENMTTQNLWDAAKSVLRGRFIAVQSYLKKQEKH